MFKVFLAEDEIVVREGLRNNIAWEQYGFTCVGDAADGEMALPLIRQLKPDLLITDIKMPFMDGLALCDFVRKELPDTHIIIISGYDDFKYAQQAISKGVDEYLLKPITRSVMAGVLSELQRKLENEREMKDYMLKFRQETREYEQFARRRFFERLVQGKLSAEEIYRGAEDLDADITARCYNIVMLSLHEPNPALANDYTNGTSELQDQLVQYITCCPEFLLFRWNLNTYAILIKGEPEGIDEATARCIENIARRCGEVNGAAWYVAAGEPVERLSSLPLCFSTASRILSYSYLCPSQHILTTDSINELKRGVSDDMEDSVIDPEQIKLFLANGETEEVDEFVGRLLSQVSENVLNSFLFCQYLCITACFAASGYIESIGCDQKLLPRPDISKSTDLNLPETVQAYVKSVLRTAIELRENEYSKRYRDMLQKAMDFINENFADAELSLNRVAKEINISPNYFSAVFSQEVGQTFTEYLTNCRMEEARRLLRGSSMRSSEIAEAVGYKDPHYFSFLFRKIQGCTPRDYRNNKI